MRVSAYPSPELQIVPGYGAIAVQTAAKGPPGDHAGPTASPPSEITGVGFPKPPAPSSCPPWPFRERPLPCRPHEPRLAPSNTAFSRRAWFPPAAGHCPAPGSGLSRALALSGLFHFSPHTRAPAPWPIPPRSILVFEMASVPRPKPEVRPSFPLAPSERGAEVFPPPVSSPQNSNRKSVTAPGYVWPPSGGWYEIESTPTLLQLE